MENYNLLKSYLVKIKQFVNFGGYESLCENNNFRVTQGLVLGLMLLYFILMVSKTVLVKITNFKVDKLLLSC